MRTRCARAGRLFLAVILVAGLDASLGGGLAGQDLDPRITVDGTPLPPTSPAIRRDHEWLVPLKAIARAVSAEIEDTGDPDTIKVRRANGAEYTVHLQTGEIRNGYLLVGRIPTGPAQLVRVNDELMFPLSGIVALFSVSVVEDAGRNTIAIETNRDDSARGPGTTGGGNPIFHLLGLDYSYGMTTNGSQYGQIARVEGQGIMGGARLRGIIETIRAPGYSSPQAAHASLRVELSPQRAVLLGDQSTYSGMDALVLSIRGVGYESKTRDFSSYYFIGRGRGSTSVSLGTSGISKYDTTIGGFSLRFRKPQREVIFAGNSFLGTERRGTTLGAAYATDRQRNYFKVDTLVGRFSGLSATTPVDGFAYGLVAVDTFKPATTLSVTAQTEHYSRNFLTARDDTRYSGQTNTALGVAFRPVSSTSLTGGVTDRVTAGQEGRLSGFNYGAQYAVGKTSRMFLGYFRNAIRDNASSLGKFDMTRYSVDVPNVKRQSFSLHYAEIQNGTSLVRDLTALTAKNTRWGHFSAHSQLQFGLIHRYGLDWVMNWGSRNSYLQLGADSISPASGKRTMSPKVSLQFPFLSGQALQLQYTREPGNHLFQFEVRGPLMARRELERSSSGGNLVVRPSNLKGRVYFDVNNDGRYEESVDKPLAGLTLWLDSTASTLTDALGVYDFKRVGPGAHRIRADLSGVPADLAMADTQERTVAVIPYLENIHDFRVLRMGRIAGKVTFLDYSADADNPIERPLPDVRVVVSPRVDTYTDADGSFTAGDLVPGEYQLAVDPVTIPEGYVSGPESIVITVRPGQQADRLRFVLSVPPRPLIEKKLAPQEVGLR